MLEVHSTMSCPGVFSEAWRGVLRPGVSGSRHAVPVHMNSVVGDRGSRRRQHQERSGTEQAQYKAVSNHNSLVTVQHRS
jgi:hypothetical protein